MPRRTEGLTDWLTDCKVTVMNGSYFIPLLQVRFQKPNSNRAFVIIEHVIEQVVTEDFS
jgi:hypothetical protein